jgi:hypothetical protein
MGDKALRWPLMNGKSHHSAEFVPLLLLFVINLALLKEDPPILKKQVLVRRPRGVRRTDCRRRFQFC